ncbi:MAG: hypothetical protein WCA19_27485 [Candidatus Acidiferrales bacterium]
MADPERTTSFAKTVDGLHKDENALDRARALKEQFDRAQNDNHQQKESQTERPPAEGSQMVKDDAPALKPAPSGPMREASDREANVAKLEKEFNSAAARIEEAKKAQETYKARQGKSREHDRDNER